MIKIYVSLICLFFIGCGYHPNSYYAKNIFGDGVFVDIVISASSPESSVSIKDAVNNAVIKRFGAKLKSRQEANSFLKINVESVAQTPIAYNEQGFISHYRTNVVLAIYFENTSGKRFIVTNSGYNDYSADYTSAIVLEQYRLESISNAANNALDKFVAQVAYYGEFYNENR